MLDSVEAITSLECMNGYSGYLSLKGGGLTSLDLASKRLGVAAARFLPRSAETMTILDLRCYARGLG